MIRNIAVMLGVALALTACNTISGIGKDVQSVGETVSDVAS